MLVQMRPEYFDAEYDNEANVWVVTSTDAHGRPGQARFSDDEFKQMFVEVNGRKRAKGRQTPPLQGNEEVTDNDEVPTQE